MNEAFDPNGSATSALFALRLITGQGETQGVIDMYARAACLHGVCPSDCNDAVAQGREDREEAAKVSTTTLFTVDEIIADLHANLVKAAHRRRTIGTDRGTRYLVCDENTLCYQLAGDSSVGILAGKGRSGRNWRDGTTHLGTFRTVRRATLKDFENFRVSPKGHVVH